MNAYACSSEKDQNSLDRYFSRNVYAVYFADAVGSCATWCSAALVAAGDECESRAFIYRTLTSRFLKLI